MTDTSAVRRAARADAGDRYAAGRLVDDLERTASDWRTYWLLEIGIRGFEYSLANRALPGWIRWPGLA